MVKNKPVVFIVAFWLGWKAKDVGVGKASVNTKMVVQDLFVENEVVAQSISLTLKDVGKDRQDNNGLWYGTIPYQPISLLGLHNRPYEYLARMDLV